MVGVAPKVIADIHQCPLLALRRTYLGFSADGRWVLLQQRSVGLTPIDGDKILLPLVLFCPMCGLDCRRDTTWAPKDGELRQAVAKALK